MKKKFLFLIIIFFASKIYSQVSLQTGSATFTLPMFNWQDNKSRLNSVVALNYNSGSGLKVNNVASNVGQGWDLSAGGVIVRMQVGEADDQKPRAGSVEDITKYPAGYLYNDVPATMGAPVALTKYPIFKDQNHVYKQHNLIGADRELDYFSFQFNGRTGMFILDKNTNNGVSLGNSNLKISFTKNENASSWGFRTTIHTFTIQDENGLKYKFGNINNTSSGNNYLGRTKVLKNNYCDAALNRSLTQPNFDNNKVYNESAFDDNDLVNPYIVTGWYLAEIEDPFTHRTISFNYNSRSINATAGTDIAHYSPQKNYILLSNKVTKTITPEISFIVYPDSHRVSFNYAHVERADLRGDTALSSVDIIYYARHLSKYQLNTSYFILNRYGEPYTEYQHRCARLCLLSVKKLGVDLKASELPYNFDYYLGSNNPDDFVPPPFFYMKDIWGYYNGSNNVSYNDYSPIPLTKSVSELSYNQLKGLCFLRNNSNNTIINPKSGYAKNGLLKQIVYPTGGSIKYEYSQNEGILNNQNSEVGGVHVSSTSTTDGGYSNGCNNPLVTHFNYVLAGGNQSSLWGIETPSNYTGVDNHYEPELKYYYYKFPFGSCAYRFQYPGILAREQSTSLSNGQKLMSVVSKILNIVGTITTIMDVANVIGGATGFMAWASVIIDIIGGLMDIVLTCFSSQSDDSHTDVYCNSDINGVNPLPAQFKRVEIVQNSGSSGRTVQEFTSEDDYTIWESSNSSLSMKQRYASWAYGLPKKVIELAVNGDTVRQTINKYDYTNAKNDFAFHPGIPGWDGYPCCKSLVKKSFSQRSTDWEDPNFYDPQSNGVATGYVTSSIPNVLIVDPYRFYTGRVELSETDERVYEISDPLQFVETKVFYQYNYQNFQVKQIDTYTSEGKHLFKNIVYSCDIYYGILRIACDNNMVTLPFETTTGFYKSNNQYFLSDVSTEYTLVPSGEIKPLNMWEKRSNIPYTYSNVPGSVLIQSFTYDPITSNLTGVKDEGNHIISNIYDYKDKYISASVINADPSTDKPSYTSFETNTTGGWTINGSGNYVPGGVTGEKSYTLGSSTLSAPLSSGKTYRLTFWATNGSIGVSSGATLKINSPTINGFTYYEYEIGQGQSTVTVSGNASIDELRLYPKTSRMRTVSYDPLMGKTSECDENNRITYYEYDELGRLRFIKDENRNIVKMYEYNTSSKAGGCPSTYSSHYAAEIFTKNNCPSGYVGSVVTYEVPAGKYTSTSSQYDADMKVQNELDDDGQNFANAHGSCIRLYYNAAVSKNFGPQRCPLGYISDSILYSVAANTYTSTVSQDEADGKALEEIKANGQFYANTHANCAINYNPVWEATYPASTQCQTGTNGGYTGHILVLMTNINPNSYSYNQTQWQDAGEDPSACPITPCFNCTGNNKRCVTGFCENGYVVYTGGVYINGAHYCTYHYEWSDGAWSPTYYELTGNNEDCIEGIFVE